MFRTIFLGMSLLVSCAPALATGDYGKAKDKKWDDVYERPFHKHHDKQAAKLQIDLGPRPSYLVDDMDDGPLKKKLQSCTNKPRSASAFSIGHRGAPLQFPEHTRESYIAAARMGAGIVECDVTFTKDKELVCRHSQCDLHTTTNILATPLAEKCSQEFKPAVYDAEGNLISPASAKCCTSDITLAEFKSLKGKMDAADSGATTVAGYLNGTARWRTDLYSSNGTLLTHKESIELFKSLGVKMTPELKSASVSMPFDGFSQQDYAQKMIGEYRAAGVSPKNVFAQSFDYADIVYWIEHAPAFGKQAVYLDGRYDLAGFDHRESSTWTPSMEQLIADGVRYLAPPMWMLVEALDGKIVPSEYAKQARAAGLDLITWTFERDGPLAQGGAWYFQTVNGQNGLPGEAGVINNDGDMYNVLHVLAQEVGIKGIFSDWPASVTYYANCMNLK